MSTQPTTCGQCSLCGVGRGFALPSGNPATTKLALVLEVPTGEDVGWFLSDPTPAVPDARSEVLRRQHLYPDLQKEWLVKGVLGAGRAGSILNNWLLPKVSIDRRDIYVTSVLRCVPPRSKQGREYPTGTTKNVAESVCRQYDRLLEFRPDAFVITFAPLDLVKEITPLPLVIRDLEKAVAFVRSGLRTVVLMGGHAAETYLGFGSNCFHVNTSVWMADRTWKRIYKIKPGDRVMSECNGQLTEKTVTNTFKKVVKGTNWWHVDVDGGYRRNQSRQKTVGGVTCTPDHKWFTKKGLVAAQDLQIGDEVFVPSQGHEELIQGTILGDATIQHGCHLSVCHTNKEWAQAKAVCFGSPLTSWIMKTGYKPGGIAYRTKCRLSTEWRSHYYSEKQKVWHTPFSPASLAVIYQDNGSIVRKKAEHNSGINGGKEVYYGASIAMHAFIPQLQEITEWFRHRYGSAREHDCNVSMSSGAAHKFFEEIAPFVHPSNYYKLPPLFRGRYNGWMEHGHVLTGKVVASKPIEITSHNRQKNTQYCLEVQDTHRFFTRVGLVANCTRWRGHYELITRWGSPETWWERVLERTSAKATKKARARKVTKGWGGQTPTADLGFGPVPERTEQPERTKRIVRCKALVSLIADEPLRECGEVREQHPTTWCGKFVGRRKKTV